MHFISALWAKKERNASTRENRGQDQLDKCHESSEGTVHRVSRYDVVLYIIRLDHVLGGSSIRTIGGITPN